MSEEHIHRNDKGHVLAEKSTPVEHQDVEHICIVLPVKPEWRTADAPLQKPRGDFRVVKPGENQPHDIGCLCQSCVARRREQAKDPHFQAIVEARAAKLPPEQAEVLRRAVYGDRRPWWKRLIQR